VAHCPQCGSQVVGKFCAQCGAQAAEPHPPSQVAAASMAPPTPPAPPPAYAPPAPPYGPSANPYGQQIAPQAGQPNWIKWAAIGGGGLLVLLLLVIFLSGSDGGGPSTVRLNATVITDQVDASSKKPLRTLATVPPTAPVIYASTEVVLPKGTAFALKWSVQGQPVAAWDFNHSFDDAYTGWVSQPLRLNAGKQWPKAKYSVQLFINGELKQQKEFEVR
jgi:hypothetical protein